MENLRVGICGGGGIIDTHCAAMARVSNIFPVALSSRSKRPRNFEPAKTALIIPLTITTKS